MSINLPVPVAAYFTADADKVNRSAVALCFTENAVVKDEGHTYTGRAAIQRWKESTKFQYSSEPFVSEDSNGMTVVTSHLVGNFPGSPVDLRYFFKIDGDKIAALEIIP
jgi:hypothetical protein